MQLPKICKAYKVKRKICQYTDPDTNESCKKEYFGHYVSRYCSYHQNVKNRKRVKIPDKKPGESDSNNMYFKHNFLTPTDVEFTCQTSGCYNKYTIKALMRLYVFPKYCLEHRNKFKRESFIKKVNVFKG